MLTDTEIRAIAQKIVDESKKTAHVDQGTLKRSLSYTVTKGKYIFRQMYYGFYGEDNPSGINSQLEENAKKMMPAGVEYQVIGTDFKGNTKETTQLKSGRKMVKSPTSGSNKQTTSNIKKLIDRVKRNRLKNGDSEEKEN
jgi:hypothetical protein